MTEHETIFNWIAGGLFALFAGCLAALLFANLALIITRLSNGENSKFAQAIRKTGRRLSFLRLGGKDVDRHKHHHA